MISLYWELVELLNSGLRCNMNKSSIVVRDPLNTIEPTSTISIGDYTFKVDSDIKYLGKLVFNLAQISTQFILF